MAILNTEEYAYIIPPSAQFNDEDGKPYSAGFVEFYKHGTSERYITYADWSGSFNPFRIPLNSQGRAVAIVPKDVFLDMYVYNFIGNLAYSRLNVNYIGEGGFTTDNLVRGIVPESDNVHTRVARTLEDGTQIYGISVDEDLWIAQAIAPNDWTPSQSTPQGVLRWYNKKLYYHITNVNTDVPPNEDATNWKSTTISDFLKSFNIDWGKLVATNTGAHGIGPWTKKSGSVDVVGGYLQLEAERIYHFTLRMEISNETYSENYYTGYITADNDGSSFQPEFELDGSKRNQIAEISWDGTTTEEDLKCYLVPTLPSGFSVTNAVLWLHSINNTILAGNGSIVVDDELSLDSDNPVQNRVVTAALNTKANSADLAPIATSGSWNDLQDVPTDLVEDPDYVHTDNNFTDADKSKLDGIEAGAEANVQADWDQTNSSADDYIKNKPANLVQDPNYVHTDNNFTNADKTKLDGVEAGAEVNVQPDWTQSDSSADDYIKNKPTNLVPIPTAQDTDKILTATGAGAYSWQNPPKGVVIVRKSDAASTVASQIATALADGKVVYCFVDIGTEDLYMPLCQVSEDGNQYRFFGVVETKTLYEQTLTKTNNVWAWDAIAEKTIIDPVQSDWTEQDTSSLAYILHKPPTLPLVEGDDIEIDEYNGSLIISSTAVPAHTAADSTKILAVDSNGELHWVDPSGSTQVQSNWNETDTSDPSYIQNKPDLSIYAQSANLATVATTGDYDDLLNKPTIPAAVTIGTIEL